jgi:hypothetical protein
MHHSPGLVPVALGERHALQPPTGPGTCGGTSSNIRAGEHRIGQAQALRGDLNRLKINGVGLCTTSAQGETADVAMPFRSLSRLIEDLPSQPAGHIHPRLSQCVEDWAHRRDHSQFFGDENQPEGSQKREIQRPRTPTGREIVENRLGVRLTQRPGQDGRFAGVKVPSVHRN